MLRTSSCRPNPLLEQALLGISGPVQALVSNAWGAACTKPRCHGQVEAAQAHGAALLEALAAGGPPPDMARRVAAAVAAARQAAAAADAGLAQTGPAVAAVTGGGVPAAQDAGTLQLQVRSLLACSYGKAASASARQAACWLRHMSAAGQAHNINVALWRADASWALCAMQLGNAGFTSIVNIHAHVV